MSNPHTADPYSILKQLAHDFLPYGAPEQPWTSLSSSQLEELWSPTLTDAKEQLIDTKLGLVNITHGGKSDGPALMFWPSLMMKGSMWSCKEINEQISNYEHFRHTHYVILIDSPGINKSEGLRKYVDLKDCSEVVINILDVLKIEKCVFGGNSWGAMLAAVLPAWIPERLLGSMVINGTADVPSTSESIVGAIRGQALMFNEKMPEWWVRIAQQAFAGNTAEKNNKEFMAYIGCVLREDPKSIAWAIKGILLGRKDFHRLLTSVKDVPVVVMAGEEDRQFGISSCEKMSQSIAGSKFVVLPKTAHLASRENPELVNREIEVWLKEIGVSGR